VTLDASAVGNPGAVQLAWDESAIDGANATPSGSQACAPSGAGISCHLPDIGPSGATFTLYARTTGLASGTTVSGSFQASAANTPAKSGTLGNWNVTAIPNTVIAISAPATPVTVFGGVSAAHPTDVSLVLSRAAIAVLSSPAHALIAASGAGPTVTLSIVDANTDAHWCPAHNCAGQKFARIVGDYSQSSKRSPALVVLKTYFVGAIKPGKVYMLKANNTLTAALAVCRQNALLQYPTPCLNGSEYHTGEGTTARPYIVYDRIFFSGADPGIGRR
jgi:hypothetical protein